MTTPAREPGEQRPRLERPPGERYRATERAGAPGTRPDPVLTPVALVLGGTIAFTVLGGIIDITTGLIVVAAFLGWLVGRLVSPPARSALVATVAVLAGFLGIWLFGRLEGGVLDPVAYLLEVEGPIVVGLAVAAGAGLAAAASR